MRLRYTQGVSLPQVIFDLVRNMNYSVNVLNKYLLDVILSQVLSWGDEDGEMLSLPLSCFWPRQELGTFRQDSGFAGQLRLGGARGGVPSASRSLGKQRPGGTGRRACPREKANDASQPPGASSGGAITGLWGVPARPAHEDPARDSEKTLRNEDVACTRRGEISGGHM